MEPNKMISNQENSIKSSENPNFLLIIPRKKYQSRKNFPSNFLYTKKTWIFEEEQISTKPSIENIEIYLKTPISTDLPYTPAEATCQNYTLLSTIMVSSQEIITEQFLKLLMKYLLSTVHFYHKMNLGFGLLKLQDIWVSSDLKSFKLVRKDRVRFEQMNSKTKHIGESFSEEIWMIGIIFLKLAKGLSHDNRNLNILRLLQLISEGNQLEEISLSLAAWDLLKKLLKKRPIERISARKALLHDWLK